MLERLVVNDFAVARSLVLEPAAGLTVFTGETGAGKSLVVEALAFVFGARRGREVITTGADRAVVEATVALPDGRITVERSIGLSGRSTARIDGAQATAEDLQALSARFVDIHGQSEQLAILRPAVQLSILDQFAGLTHQRDDVAGIVRELRSVRRGAESLARDTRERERLVGQLRFEVEEITAAALSRGEDETLRQEHARLASAGRLLEDVGAALDAIERSSFGEIVQAAADIVARDPSAHALAELSGVLESSAVELRRALRRYRETVEEDPARLAAVEERLDRIARLRRKYGDSVEEIITYGREAEARLGALTGAGASLDVLREREQELLARLASTAAALSRARRASAGNLVRAIAKELEHLAMGGATLSVGFACDDDPDGPAVSLPDYEIVITETPLAGEGEPHARAFSESGVDRVEFLASFNAGESARPLSAVSSGGETSRFLLALTTVLGSAAEPRLVVLDEVDEGVGGRAGALVGEVLSRLARRHQVLCVTHLPQVAAFGERHLVVSKRSDGARTWSEVEVVEGEARLDELASMLGGASEANRAAARELLAKAEATAARPG